MRASQQAQDNTGDNKRVRYTLELTNRLDAILEDIAQSKGSTKAEVLRFAIDFLDAGYKAKNDGMTVGGWSEDASGNKREREFVGL